MSKKELQYNESIIEKLRSGLNSPFHEALREIIKENMADLSRQVLEDDSITDQQRNNLRMWHGFLSWFVELPEKVIQSAENEAEQKPTEYDPFPKIKDKLLDANN